MEVLVILYKSGLSMDEVLSRFKKRSDRYRDVKGLLQKLYVRDESTDHVGGIYVFDSKESLEAGKIKSIIDRRYPLEQNQ